LPVLEVLGNPVSRDHEKRGPGLKDTLALSEPPFAWNVLLPSAVLLCIADSLVRTRLVRVRGGPLCTLSRCGRPSNVEKASSYTGS
jgi:hypothetical protein